MLDAKPDADAVAGAVDADNSDNDMLGDLNNQNKHVDACHDTAHKDDETYAADDDCDRNCADDQGSDWGAGNCDDMFATLLCTYSDDVDSYAHSVDVDDPVEARMKAVTALQQSRMT